MRRKKGPRGDLALTLDLYALGARATVGTVGRGDFEANPHARKNLTLGYTTSEQ